MGLGLKNSAFMAEGTTLLISSDPQFEQGGILPGLDCAANPAAYTVSCSAAANQATSTTDIEMSSLLLTGLANSGYNC